MTSAAELNQARLSLQLQINQAEPQVRTFEFLVDDGAPWPEISQRWDTLSGNLSGITSSITNLQQQNSGVPDFDPGKVALAAKLIENQRANSNLRTRMDQVKRDAVSNGNSDANLNNLPTASAGTEVIEAQDAAVGDSRVTSPTLGTETLVVLKDKDGNITGTDIIPAGTVDLTNARLATLRGDFSSTIDTAPGGGVISTTGGGIEFPGIRPGGVSKTDDAYTANANGVDGRVAIASEFLQTITAAPNRLAGLASQTYTISIYIMDVEEYDRVVNSDRKTLPSQQLIMQSGGATIGERNKFFDLDFYPENIELKCLVGTQGAGSPHNAVTLEFDVLEPQGITFLERLRRAVWDHTGIPGATINGQNYLMVIRFYGYDENGNLVSGSAQNGGETTSDPNAIVEKFIPFQIAMLKYKLAAQVVEYQLQCMIPQTTVGFSTSRGSIPFNFQLDAPDVGTLFNGNMQLSAGTIAANEFAAGDAQGGEFGTGNQKAGSSAPTVTQGLTDALNQNQLDLVKKGAQEIADKYIILLEDIPGFKDAKMKKQGTTNKKTTPMTVTDNPNILLNSKKQNFDNAGRTYSITAGTQITQLIDQVMKNSEYVTAQQTVVFDEVTKKEISNPPVQTTMWYKITQKSKAIGWDNIRKDYAYEITYKVNRYQINTPKSPYFSPSTYRGSHKIYEYLFTGLNTEVLNLEFEANTNYITPIGNNGLTAPVVGDGRFANKQMHSPGAESSQQGGAGESTLPAAQLAGRLYAESDVLKVELEIVGDPDWITQSEVFYTEDNLSPFEADGSMNVNSSEVLFEVRFNRANDYDLATGLTPKYEENINQGAINNNTNIAEERLVFAAYSITNMFKAGKFTQRIEGTLREFTADNLASNQGVSVPRTNNKNGLKTYTETDEELLNKGYYINYTDDELSDIFPGGVAKNPTNALDDDGAGPF